jgi:thiamine biosynthesis protein ThiC
MNKTLWLALTMIAAGSTMLADDAKKVTSRDGNCQVTVPSTWMVSPTAGIGNSADKKVNVTVGAPQRVTSYDSLKENARKLYSGDKVTKDSATEFQMEGQSMSGKPNVYRAIPIAGGKYCVMEVVYQSGTLNAARKIAESLRSPK